MNIILLALILLIVFMQAVYGLFSSLIMAICTLVCTLLAFSYYEQLASLLVNWQPAYAHAGSLVALMVLPLILVRFLVDSYLPGNIVSTVWVDRVGGGVLGLFSALLLSGTVLIAAQMLPFGPAIMGYNPYEDDLKPKDSLLINSPAFTLAMVEKLSAGSMAGSDFTSQHEDLVLESWGVRNRDDGSGCFTTTTSAKLVGIYDVSKMQYPGTEQEDMTFESMTPAYPNQAEGGSKIYLARIKFDKKCSDTDKWWRISLTQLQMKMNNGQMVFPVGYLLYGSDWSVVSGALGSLRINRPVEKSSSLVADVLFRAPSAQGTDALKPKEINFRRVCNMPIAKVVSDALPEVDDALSSKETYGEVKVVATGSKVPFIARPIKAIVNNIAPFIFSVKTNESGTLDADLMVENSVVNGRVVNFSWVEGLVAGDFDVLDKMGGRGPRSSMFIRELAQPEKLKIVKLLCAPIQSQGILGGIAEKVGALQPQIRVAGYEDAFAVGAWVKWNENGKDYGYMFYSSTEYRDPNLDEPALNPAIAEVFSTYLDHRKQSSEFGLMFLAADGAKVTGFRLTGNERFSCESPLSTGVKPRKRRR